MNLKPYKEELLAKLEGSFNEVNKIQNEKLIDYVMFTCLNKLKEEIADKLSRKEYLTGLDAAVVVDKHEIT